MRACGTCAIEASLPPEFDRIPRSAASLPCAAGARWIPSSLKSSSARICKGPLVVPQGRAGARVQGRPARVPDQGRHSRHARGRGAQARRTRNEAAPGVDAPRLHGDRSRRACAPRAFPARCSPTWRASRWWRGWRERARAGGADEVVIATDHQESPTPCRPRLDRCAPREPRTRPAPTGWPRWCRCWASTGQRTLRLLTTFAGIACLEFTTLAKRRPRPRPCASLKSRRV